VSFHQQFIADFIPTQRHLLEIIIITIIIFIIMTVPSVDFGANSN